MLRTILILIFCWYGFTLLARFVLPILLRFLFKKTVEKATKNQNNNSSATQKEGEIRITHKPERNKSNNLDGDYVDFEELK